MGVQKFLEALRLADETGDETVTAAGPLLIWCLRKRTHHPRLAEAFPEGCLLVTRRGLPEEDGSVEEEAAGCRVPLPRGTGLCEEAVSLEPCDAWQGGAASLEPCARFDYALWEDRLEPLSLEVARRLLSDVSRSRTSLSLPLLLAVHELSDDEVEPGRAPRHHCTAYLGARTQQIHDAENKPPGRCGNSRELHILETIRVLRPVLPASVTIGEALRSCRGASRGGEVWLRSRYDLSTAADQMSAWAWALPPEELPGPFVSLQVSWPLSLQQASSAPLLQSPATLTCTAVVHIRCHSGECGGGGPEKASPLLGRYVDGLRILEHLARPLTSGAASKDDVLQTACSANDSAHNDRSPPLLCDESAVGVALARLAEEERRRATASAARMGGVVGSAPMAADPAGDEERPGRDFIDRLWLDVASRCATVPCMVSAIQMTLRDLGRPGGLVPFVHRENGTELAELARTAVKISRLRSYAAMSEAQQLVAMVTDWEERCSHFSKTEVVLAQLFDIGAECLRKDFLHVVTCRGYVTAQDLGALAEPAPTLARTVQLERLRGLGHVAELVLTCTRHRLCSDTLRRLVLKAAEYYQRPATTNRLGAPIFAAPLVGGAIGRLLSVFRTVEPSSECGGASLRAVRAFKGDAPEQDAEEGAEPGSWCPAVQGSPFGYNVTAVDRFEFYGKSPGATAVGGRGVAHG